MTGLLSKVNENDHLSANFRMNCFNFRDFYKIFQFFVSVNTSSFLIAHEDKGNIFIFKDFEVFNLRIIFFFHII
jgi:hypothetical protein